MAQALVQRACAKLRSAIGDEAVLRLNFTSDLQEVLVALEVLQTVMEKTEMQLTRPSPAPVWFQEMTRMLPRLAIKKNDVANKVEEMKEKVIGLKKTFQSYIYEGPVLIQHQQLRRAGDKPRSMLLFEPLVLGRRADKQKIVNMLLSAASNITKGRPRSIILPIFGFATSGMTTMAMMVFSDTHSFTQQYDFRVWASTAAEANPSKRLAAKLSATAKALTSWNDRFIGNVKLQILVANELILRLDVAMESRALSRGERGLRKLLKGKLLGLASLERTIARQRSRITWLSEGDACTRFFHLHANHRRRKNFITHFKVDGSLVADQEGKAKAADAFYEQLLGPSPDRGFSLDLDYLGMQSHDLVELDAPFSEEEASGKDEKNAILCTMHHLAWGFADCYLDDVQYRLLTDYSGELATDHVDNIRALRCVGCSKMEFKDDSFSLMRHLDVLELKESPVQKLPDSIWQLRHLGYLKISEFSALVTLPESLGHLINVFHIDLSGCSRLGLKDAMGQLTKLRYLNLSMFLDPIFYYHQSHDSVQFIRDCVRGLSSLEHLDLSHNKFLVDLPESLGDLKKLHILDLLGCIRLKRNRRLSEVELWLILVLNLSILQKTRCQQHSLKIFMRKGIFWPANVVQTSAGKTRSLNP
ncbi:hypothetical protein ACQ4PT_067074 [Festuca glaucescens]